MKIMTVFGTRPEAIKMAPLALALGRDGRFECCVCVTGQHRELLDQVLDFFRIRPDADLDIMQEGLSLPQTASRILLGMDRVIKEKKPDLVLVHGDTTTSFAAALAAFYNHVPVGHVEAGLRTGNKYSPFPEEMDRRLTARIADLHFAPTEENRAALIAEGIDPSRIYVTGNTAIDALNMVKSKSTAPAVMALDGTKADLSRLESKRLMLLTCHRRENYGRNMNRILTAVRRIASDFPDVFVICPVHPSPEAKNACRLLEGTDNILLASPVPYADMLALLDRSYMLVTDSGGLQEEASALGIPTAVIRNETERVEAVKCGAAVIAGVDEESVYSVLSRLLSDSAYYKTMAAHRNLYGDGRACERIIALLAEYEKVF